MSVSSGLRARFVFRRPPLVALAGSAVCGLSAWTTAGLLAVAAEGVSSRMALLAPWWVAVAAGAPVMVLAAVLPIPARCWWPSLVPLVLLLAWLPVPVPAAALMWVGPLAWLVWAVAVGGLLCAWWPASGADRRPAFFDRLSRAPGRASATVFALGFMIYSVAAWRASPVLPAGDAPHYLIITQSLLRDGDLRIENNHAREDYAAYFSAELKPDYLRRGADGQIYSIHAPGLPAIVAPAFAAGGYPGVVVFLALLSAFGASIAWRTALLLTGSAGAAWFGWAAVALSAPFLLHSFQVFPDALGAVLTMMAAAALVQLEVGTPTGRGRGAAMPWILRGAALAGLPWLHTRFAVIAVVLGACLASRLAGARRYRDLFAFGLVPVVSGAAWFSFFRAIYGTFSPAAPYGSYTQSSAGNMLAGLPALLLDQQFGILPNAPVFAVAFVGLILMFRKRRRLTAELTLVTLAYLSAVASYNMWWGGWSPPARFAVPVLLLMALPAADFWARKGAASRASALVALGVSLLATTVLVAAEHGRLMFNGRDGFARWLEWVSPLVDLPRAVPSFLRAAERAEWAQSAVWIAVLGLAWGALAAGARAMSGPEKRRALLALAAPLAFAAAAMLATSICWRLDGASPLTPTTAQTRLLRSFDLRPVQFGLQYHPLRVMAAADIVPRLCLRTSTRRAPPAATPLFLTSVPAGTYLLEPAVAYAAGYRTIEVRIGRSARPIQQWEVNGSQAAGAMLVRLPLGVTALTVSGAQTPGRAAGMLALRPLAGRREPPFPNPGNPDVGQLASRAARYGSVVVLAFTQLVFLEEQGFWMMAGRDDCIVVAPDEPTGRVTLLARNGPYPNVVTLATRDWNARLELASREERELDVPLDRASGAVVLQVHAEKGFRPSDVEPGSRDDRDLGVWFEVVTPSTREMTSVIPHF